MCSVPDQPRHQCMPMKETWVQTLGQEDSLEDDMAMHTSILAWEIPWTQETGKLQSMRFQELDTV